MGAVFGKTKRNLLLSSDIVLLPTYLSETFPTIILESYKYGTPVVSYYFRGVKEIVIDGKTGVIIRRPSYIELAKTISKFITHRYMLRLMGLNALNYVNNFCTEYVIPQIIKLYIHEIYKAIKKGREYGFN